MVSSLRAEIKQPEALGKVDRHGGNWRALLRRYPVTEEGSPLTSGKGTSRGAGSL